MEDNNEYGNMIWVDTRNATNDHRTGARPVPFFPGGNRIPAGWNRAPQPAAYPQQPQVIYAPARPALGSTLLANVSLGQVADMFSQVIAAFMPLPSQPVVMKDATVDAGNAIVYQGALAAHAKRDELIRTIGAIAVKVFG